MEECMKYSTIIGMSGQFIEKKKTERERKKEFFKVTHLESMHTGKTT